MSNTRRTERKYDYVVIDNPPSQYELVIEALSRSTNILIPFDCEEPSTNAVIDTIVMFGKKNIDLENVQGIIPNKYLHFHKILHNDNIDLIKEAVDFEGSTIRVYDKVVNRKMFKEISRTDEYPELLEDVIRDILE